MIKDCFCGNSGFFTAAHDSYITCASCGTARLKPEFALTDSTIVTDDANHLYGKEYWDSHQVALGLPPIEVRARNDLSDRAQYWLAHLLQFKLPPGRALEIGCAHGGFVKLMKLAGFDAVGIEMSPQIIQESRERFDVTIIKGPIEEVAQEIGRFDVIVLLDVLEHVHSPNDTIATTASFLADDGVMVVQTPRHDQIDDAQWPMFLPPEHTFLYSSKGLKLLLNNAGLSEVLEVPARFPYDQFLFASARPLQKHSADEIHHRLQRSPDSRMVLAMQDIYEALNSARNVDPAIHYGTRRLAGSLVRAIGNAIKRRTRPRQTE